MKLTGVVNMEKQTTILEHAMVEFAKQGYHKASTNTISKAANLSKGLIFHYYKSKESLFRSAIEEALARLNKTFQDQFSYQSRDLFERLTELMTYKALVLRNPDPAIAFITTLGLDENHDLRTQVRKVQEDYNNELYQQLLHDLDMSEYREDFTLQEMMSISLMVLEKVGDQILNTKVEPDQLANQLEQAMKPWIQTLQRLFKKEKV